MFSKEEWRTIVSALEKLQPESDPDRKVRDAALGRASTHAKARTKREQRAINLARVDCNDEFEIDDEPEVSPTGEGVWVAAWTWVPTEDICAISRQERKESK